MKRSAAVGNLILKHRTIVTYSIITTVGINKIHQPLRITRTISVHKLQQPRSMP